MNLFKLFVMNDTTKIKVLVVEDDDMNYIYLRQVFKILGSELVRVSKGKKAIEKCKDSHFDLVMMDIQLPDINGYEVTKAIRKSNPDIPIIAQTASKNPEDHEKALESGCNLVLVKPYKIDDIRDIIQKLDTLE